MKRSGPEEAALSDEGFAAATGSQTWLRRSEPPSGGADEGFTAAAGSQPWLGRSEVSCHGQHGFRCETWKSLSNCHEPVVAGLLAQDHCDDASWPLRGTKARPRKKRSRLSIVPDHGMRTWPRDGGGTWERERSRRMNGTMRWCKWCGSSCGVGGTKAGMAEEGGR